MFEFWISYKVWTEVIPVIILFVLLIGIFLSTVIACLIESYSWKLKTKWLQKHGFERYLAGVPSVGNGAFYAWRNHQTNQQIDEKELKKLKYKDLVKKMRG